MGQVIVSDLLDQATYREDFSGVSATRKFLVDGLTGEPSRKQYECAKLPDVPKVGDPHPSIPQLFVASVDVTAPPMSPYKAWVLVTYGTKSTTLTPPSGGNTPGTVEMGATSSQIETTRDKDGKEMILTYTQVSETSTTTGGITTTDKISNTITQPFKASVNESHPYLMVSRLESNYTFSKTLEFQNTVNAVAFAGYPPRTWYCNAIRATKQGAFYLVSYEFQYRKKTWNAEGTATDSSTGAPVANPKEGEGHKFFQVYTETDFNQLGII